MNKTPKIHSSEIIFDDFFKIRKDTIEERTGKLRPYTSLLLPGDAAIVLAQDSQNRYIVNYEYRHPARRFLLGCPGGLIDKGEDPIAGGRRELLEETGYFAEDIHLTGCAYPFPGICDQKIYYLFAKNAVKKNEPTLDPLEVIETRLMSENELIEAIRTWPNIDAILCTALWYKNLSELK
jgi:ADP-ribose pyrophosphatase